MDAPSEDVLRRAAAAIKSDNPELPVVFDPFAGSGSRWSKLNGWDFRWWGLTSTLSRYYGRTLAELLPPLADVPSISPAEPDARLQEDLRNLSRAWPRI